MSADKKTEDKATEEIYASVNTLDAAKEDIGKVRFIKPLWPSARRGGDFVVLMQINYILI